MLGTDETMDMKLAKELKPIKNKQIYEADAKANLVSTHVDSGRNKIWSMPELFTFTLSVFIF